MAVISGSPPKRTLRNNNFPPELIASFFGSMQVGDYTQPVRFGGSGKWYVFKLAEKRLATENLTLESPGVRQQITQGLTNQRKQILNAALLDTAMNEAKIVNHLAANMLNNPSNLGLRPAAEGAAPASSPTQAPVTSADSGPGSLESGGHEFARIGEACGVTEVVNFEQAQQVFHGLGAQICVI